MNYTSDLLKFTIGKFTLHFSNKIYFETFNDPDNYYGITFHINGKRYQVIESKLGTRLLINGAEGEAKDIPFNDNTVGFLPDGIDVKTTESLRAHYNRFVEKEIQSMKIVQLEQTCSLCPEQWEGKTADGKDVYARERHGLVRVDLDGETIFTATEGTAFDALTSLFELPKEYF